ncbi:Alpha/Beta hydrolase protein [Phlyctochytrium arcticum]|nr:Alpha/Beta hydrolase protein [Phlyctochytrium arcticum]
MARSVTLHNQEELKSVESTGGTLETRIFHGSIRKETCVVFAHPYGPLGGNLENNVVRALFDNFATQGYMTVRFNFRGVGYSQGRTSLRGQGEMEDVQAICRFVRGRHDLAPKKIILCGYSYGSVAMGAAACTIPELAGFISISYPCGVMWFLTLFNSAKASSPLAQIPAAVPKLYITGTEDNFTSLATFTKLMDTLPTENRTVLVVPDANHFWAQKEEVVVGHVTNWMNKTGLNAKVGARSVSAGPGSMRVATTPSHGSQQLTGSPWSS